MSEPNARGFDSGFVTACVFASLGVGLITRLPFFAGIDFPLNDGGLFLAMIESIREAGFSLPSVIEYNGRTIPFGYPPFAFYLAAAISSITGATPLSVVLYAPLVFNLACLPLFVLVTAHLVDRRSSLFFAAILLPLIPRSYEWMIMGGGMSRSPGFFLALVGMLCATRAVRDLDRRWLVATTLALGLTLSTHLEWGITGWTTVALYMLFHRQDRATLFAVIAIGFGMGVVSAPWWVTVVAQHGIDPFLAASQTASPSELTFVNRMRALDVFTLGRSWLTLFGAIGFGIAISRRQFFVPVWLISIFLFTPRHGATPAALPVAILAGLTMSCLADALLEGLRWLARLRVKSDAASPPEKSSDDSASFLAHAVVLVLAFAALAHDTTEVQEYSPLVALGAPERAGMEWIRDNTEPGTRFLVLSLAKSWETDRTAEWFPIIARRHSANTPQGLEWVRSIPFAQESLRGDVQRQVVNVSPSSAPVMGRRVFGTSHSHVAVFAKTGHPIHLSYMQSPLYEQLHTMPNVSIYRMADLGARADAIRR